MGESRGAFDRLLPLLPHSLHVVAVDQRGHGDASSPAEGYGLDQFAEDIEAFMAALGVSAAVLVGSSSGGYVAQQVAINIPHGVAGLVLVGSPRDLRGRPAFADEVNRLTDPTDPAWVRNSLSWFPRFRQVPQWYIDDRVRDGAKIAAHVWRDTFNGLVTARPPTLVAPISAPTLIVCGDRDAFFPPEDQQALAAAIPTSRLVVYENTGHLVLWEQPERLALDLIAFMDSLGR